MERVAHITSFLERLQVVELILRLSKDLRLLDVKQFAEIVTVTDSLGRQAERQQKQPVQVDDVDIIEAT